MLIPLQHHDDTEFIYHRHSDHRPSPRSAVVISLLVHTLLVLLLYEAYAELASAPPPPLTIMARDTKPRRVSSPSFSTEPVTKRRQNVVQLRARPTANVPPVPRQAMSSTRERIPIRHGNPSPPTDLPRREVGPATLPVYQVDLPPVETSAVVPVDAPVSPLRQTDSLAMTPPNFDARAIERLASLPTDRVPSRRPTSFAHLPTSVFARQDLSRRGTPAEAFAHRHDSAQASPENQAAIERGLEFLARVQLADGRWRFGEIRGLGGQDSEPVNIRADAAATGLALLAFLGDGHDHFDGRFRFVIDDGLQFLMRVQGERGEFVGSDQLPAGPTTQFYSHGIATLSLSEAYGMTGDEELRVSAQGALNYLADARTHGSDATAIGWQLAALQSGQLAGLEVEPRTLTLLTEKLTARRAIKDKPAAAAAKRLTPLGDQPDPVNTAVGLAVELHLGGEPGDERLRPAAEHLLANPPDFPSAPAAAQPNTNENPQRDTYYWYYGSQAMFYLGGNDWQAWSRKLFPQLIKSQVESGPLAGSWDSIDPVTENGAFGRGRLYVTAMNLLSLETQQRQLRVGSRDKRQNADETN